MITDATDADRTYHHNGDFSGDVLINVAEDEVRTIPGGGLQVAIPMADLIDIVARYVRRERVIRLETASPRDVLGIERSRT